MGCVFPRRSGVTRPAACSSLPENPSSPFASATGGFDRTVCGVTMDERLTLSLHVPEPEVRPGGAPDFSKVKIAPAGSVRRPPVDVDPADIRDMAYDIIRVLNRDGEAVGDWAGTLDDDAIARGPEDDDAGARLRPAHADGPAPGQDELLHAVPRRGGDRLRLPAGAAARRHELSRPIGSRGC